MTIEKFLLLSATSETDPGIEPVVLFNDDGSFVSTKREITKRGREREREVNERDEAKPGRILILKKFRAALAKLGSRLVFHPRGQIAGRSFCTTAKTRFPRSWRGGELPLSTTSVTLTYSSFCEFFFSEESPSEFSILIARENGM